MNKKYVILTKGKYKDFTKLAIIPGGKASLFATGDIVEFPEHYGESLVLSGSAREHMGVVKEIASKISEKVMPKPKEEINATDGAKELAEANGVDLALVKGTGASGRIMKSDVSDYIENGEA